MCFCILCRNSRWPQKVAEKQFFLKIASRLFIYPVAPKFCRSRSISHCFRDKCFYVSRRNSRWPLKVVGKSRQYFDKMPLSHTVKEIEASLCFCIFRNNSKIKNGRHFWGEENFFENWQEYILWIENFDEITLARTVKEIEAN